MAQEPDRRNHADQGFQGTPNGIRTRGYWCGHQGLTGNTNNACGGAHGRARISSTHRGGVVLSASLEGEEAAQVPGCLLAVLTGTFRVSRCLRVLTSPHCPGTGSGDGVSCQNAGMNRVADGGRVVAQPEGVPGHAQEFLSLGQEGGGLLGTGGSRLSSRPGQLRQQLTSRVTSSPQGRSPRRRCSPTSKAPRD